MILIAGPGAVGTILATYLGRAGQAVRMLVREKDANRFLAASALRVDPVGGGAPLTAPRPEITTAPDLSGVRYLLVCVKYKDLDALLDQLPAPLPPGLTLVSTLNGVGAIRRVRERFPGQPAASMTVMFNGQVLGPLHAQITTRAVVLIGSDDPDLPGLFAGSGMKAQRASGEAAIWGKLLINLGNAVCALTHATIKDLLSQPDLRRVYTAVLDEAVGLMEGAGIRYQLPMPIPYPVYRRILLHGGPLPWWFARARNGVREGAYFSMVADIEAGRPTETPQLNGEIVALGREHRRPAPVNARIVELVRELEGRRPPAYLRPEQVRAALGLA